MTILKELKQRNLYEPYKQNITERLRSSLARLSSEEIESLYEPFDDLALICASELSDQNSNIIWKLIEEKTNVSIPILIQFVLKKRSSLLSLIQGIFPILQTVESQESGDKCAVLLTLLLLFKENIQPYITIQNRLESNPNEMTEDELLLLLPSLVCYSKNIGSEQAAVFKSAHFGKSLNIINEIKEATNLKNYKVIE